MARHYSVRDFFRQMPNAMLARYFERRGLFGELDFTAMKETRTDALFVAWLALPADVRKVMEAEFREIQDMSNENGSLTIVQEARWQMRDRPEAVEALVDLLAGLPSHFERAMVTFLDYRDCWWGATLFHHADRLPYWRKRKNVPRCAAAVDDASIEQLAALIRNHFHETEGRGRNCLVDALRRDDRDYFFAYPEDYAQGNNEWVGDELKARPHNPAFEVVFVYSQRDGTLDVNCKGTDKKVTHALQSMFAKAILKLGVLPREDKDEQVYDLDRLARRGFAFAYPIDSGIDRVAVKRLRLSSCIKDGDRITLEADPTDDPDAIYALVEQVARGVPLNHYNVTQVDLEVRVVVDPAKPAKTVTVRITYPNSCTLKSDGVDAKLRAMLEASGVEPKAPAALPGAAVALVA